MTTSDATPGNVIDQNMEQLLNHIDELEGQVFTEKEFENISKTIAQWWYDVATEEISIWELKNRSTGVSVLLAENIGQKLTEERAAHIQAILRGQKPPESGFKVIDGLDDWQEVSHRVDRYQEYYNKLVLKHPLQESPYERS